MNESANPPLIQEIPLSKIHPSQFSLRPLAEKTVTEIAISMQQQGQLSPVLVRPVGDDYELVYGNHRLAAARQLNWSTIRCEIRPLTAEQAFFAAWVENTARNEFLDPIAEARGFATLMQRGYAQAAIAREINRQQQYVSGRMGLLRLELDIQVLITSGLVPAEHGVELSRLDASSSRILAQLCRRDRQHSLRLEQLRDLAKLAPERLAEDPRVEPPAPLSDSKSTNIAEHLTPSDSIVITKGPDVVSNSQNQIPAKAMYPDATDIVNLQLASVALYRQLRQLSGAQQPPPPKRNFWEELTNTTLILMQNEVLMRVYLALMRALQN